MKKIITFAIAVLMLLALSACNNNNQITDKTATPENDSVVNSTDSQSPDVLESNDALDVYELPNDFQLKSGSRNLEYYCLVRDSKKYSLGGFITAKNSRKYQIGYLTFGKLNSNGISDNDAIEVFHDLRDKPETPNGYFLACGDVSLLELTAADEIRGYDLTDLYLYKAELYGYSLSILEVGNGRISLISSVDGSGKTSIDLDDKNAHFQVVDQAGNVQTDYHNLAYNEGYTVSWYEGTTYREWHMEANNPCYYICEGKKTIPINADYHLEGNLTQDGYAKFDLSGVEAGIYYDGKSSFFIVK